MNYNNGLFVDETTGQTVYAAMGKPIAGASGYHISNVFMPTWRSIGYAKPQGNNGVFLGAGVGAKGNLNMAPIGMGHLLVGGYMGDGKSYYCPTADNTMPHHETTYGASANAQVAASRDWQTLGGTGRDSFLYGNYRAFSSAANPLYSVVSNYAYRNVGYAEHGGYFNCWNSGGHTNVFYTKPTVVTSHNLGLFKTQKYMDGRALVADGFSNGASHDSSSGGLTGGSISRSLTQPLPLCADGNYAHKEGYNVLYADGAARWFGDPDQRVIFSITQVTTWSYGQSFITQQDGDICVPPEYLVGGYMNHSYPQYYNASQTSEVKHIQYAGAQYYWHMFDQANGMDVGAAMLNGNVRAVGERN
jgi:prepilin-type processing-associated H-X9-DG protein